MDNGDVYVVNSQNTLYRIPNSSCSEGDSITLNNTVVDRVFLVNGKFIVSDRYTVNNYSSSTYTCHVWDGSLAYNVNDLILPATIIMVAFFSIIYKWFIRLRG